MADNAAYKLVETPPRTNASVLDVRTAIALLEAEEADTGISVDLGEGVIARADGPLGMHGLLQRLRHYQLLKAACDNPLPADTLPRLATKPHLHPRVAEILSALTT